MSTLVPLRRLAAVALALLAQDAAAAAASAPPEEPSPSAVLFGKRCGGCHTIGQGDRTGPDLLGVLKRRDKAWIKQFVHGPSAAIDRGDPIANELFARFKNVRMPDQALSDDELAGLFAYFDACTAKGGCRIVLGKVRPASESTPADVQRGRELFTGVVRLQNGGPPCMSCHAVRGVGPVGGGTLAKDLTFVYARLGDNGVTSALETTPFPLMKDVFARHALTQPEGFALKAFFYDAARDGTPPQPDHDFFYLGVSGLLVALALFGAAWSGRVRNSRREALLGQREQA